MYLNTDITISEYSAFGKKYILKDIEKKNTLLLTLSIFQDEIEASIADLQNNNIYWSVSYLSQKKFSNEAAEYFVADFIHRFNLQKITFKEVLVIYGSHCYTFCPAAFYISEKKEELLKLNHIVRSEDLILTDSYDNIKIIHSIPTQIHQNLLQVFPQAKLYHSSTAMLNIIFSHPSLFSADIWVHIHSGYIEVITKKGTDFLFYTTFDTQTPLDVLYYILFSIEQIKCEPSQTDIFISGNISLDHSIFQLLKKYIRSLQVLSHNHKLHILPTDNKIISHHHFITINFYLCALYQENIKAEK